MIRQSLPLTSPTRHDNTLAQHGTVKFLPVYSLYFAHNFETVRNTQLFDATMFLCKRHSEINVMSAIIPARDLVRSPVSIVYRARHGFYIAVWVDSAKQKPV